MLRQAASRLGTSGLFRSIATSAARLEGEAAPAGVKEFQEEWAKTAPSTLALPELPTNFVTPEASGESAVDGERFSINFFTPHGVVAQTKVRQNSSICCPDHRRCCCCCCCSRVIKIDSALLPYCISYTLVCVFAANVDLVGEKDSKSSFFQGSRLCTQPYMQPAAAE